MSDWELIKQAFDDYDRQAWTDDILAGAAALLFTAAWAILMLVLS